MKKITCRFGITVCEVSYEATEGGILVSRKSMFTNKMNEMVLPISEEEFLNYVGRKGTNRLIQYVFPNLSSDEREFILTGTTPEEWNAVFGKDA